MTIETIGIEKIDSKSRKGSPRSLFTLWFAANLTIADFALGFLPISFGMSISSSILAVLIGNILGSIVVGVSAIMGPKTGYPQMMSTTNSMGKSTMRLFGIVNLSNTLGWFIINNVLAVTALYLIFKVSYVFLMLIFVGVVYVIAYIGHDFIHKIEKILSYILGLMFLFIFVYLVTSGKMAALSLGRASFDYYFFGMIALSYSYLMSWGPYASDYSRYLPENSNQKKVFGYVLLGSFISTTFVEIVAILISFIVLNPSLSAMSSLQFITGKFSVIALLAIVFGGVSANVLNMYSSTLSGLVGGVKMKRTKFVGIIAIIGLALSLLFYNGFYTFFEDFLLILAYWISPWIAILATDFLVFKRHELKFDRRLISTGVLSYVIGLLASVPFMDIGIPSVNWKTMTFSTVYFPFPISKYFNGIDISYFVSVIISVILYLSFSKLIVIRKGGITNITFK